MIDAARAGAGIAFVFMRERIEDDLRRGTLREVLPGEPRARRRPDHALRAAVGALRDAGEVVIQALPGHDHVLDEFACDRALVERDGAWVIEPR